MKKWNIFLLGLGYAAGLLVALKFTKGGKNKGLPELAEDIKTVHKNLWTEGEAKIFSEENRERVAKFKTQAMSEIDSFRKEAEKTLADLTKKGELKKEEIEEKLMELYESRKEIFQDLLDDAVSAVKNGYEEGEDVVVKLEKKIKSLAKDLTGELESTYKDIKKKIR